MFAVRPAVVDQALLCAYYTDASTFNSKCSEPGASTSCLPGCYGATWSTLNVSGWCNTPSPMQVYGRFPGGTICPFPPAGLKAMMLKQEHHTAAHGQCQCCSWPKCALFNEVVLDSAVWSQHLPWTVEAVVFPADSPGAEVLARKWHRKMLDDYQMEASELPLVRMGDVGSEAPFSLADS